MPPQLARSASSSQSLLISVLCSSVADAHVLLQGRKRNSSTTRVCPQAKHRIDAIARESLLH
eukprot:4743064-Pyramimonas_sp.AAC.1